jgi:2-haloacid dehalogenase
MAVGQDTAKHGREGRAIDAVFFDLFGTLLDLSALVEDCEQAAPGRGRELAARWRAWQLEFSWLRTTMGTFVDFDRITADALEAAIAELGLELATADDDTLTSAFERLPVHPAAPGVLGRLRSSGVRTGVLTNGSRRTLGLVVARTGLDRMLDYALSVDAVRRFKPGLLLDAGEARRLPHHEPVRRRGSSGAGGSRWGNRSHWSSRDAPDLRP